jgi:polyisoprenoid-binding protein YceI
MSLQKGKVAAFALPLGLALALVRCAPADASAAATPAGTATAADAPAPAVATRGVVAPTGNEARYRVREQLMGRDLPNDAVGATAAVTGAIALDSAGAVVPAASHFVVDVTGLKTDSDRRDNYVRRRVLETEAHPRVELRPTALRGLPARLSAAAPPAGKHTLQLVGDLTVRGVTRPTTWQVTAEYRDGRVVGTAATAFAFGDFSIAQPRVPIVLSVADTIRLEYDFTLVPEGPGTGD